VCECGAGRAICKLIGAGEASGRPRRRLLLLLLLLQTTSKCLANIAAAHALTSKWITLARSLTAQHQQAPGLAHNI